MMTAREVAAFGLEDAFFSDEAFARSTLRKAVHRRKVTELRSAIQGAEAAGTLYDFELAGAKRTLDMQRKANARSLIAEAKASADVAMMRAAIAESEAVGLPAGELLAAARAMEEEERRDRAREGLAAVACGATLAEFHAALQEGEAAGLAHDELEIARAALAVEEQFLVARQVLEDAVRSRDMSELRAALEQGSRVGLQGYELFDAERVLAEEEVKISVKSQLKDALLKKVWSTEEQIDALKDAIAEARSAGLDIMDIERAKWFLEFEERQHEARQALAKAIQTSRLEDLRAAIEGGREAGLKATELLPAQELIAESYKPAARDMLAEAVASTDIEQLKRAIAHGEAVGISELGLKNARHVLEVEERKVDARSRIFKLVGDGSSPYILPMPSNTDPGEGYTIGELRAAAKFGEVSGLADDELGHVRVVLRAEERKILARKRLGGAEEARSIEMLEVAIAEGDAAHLLEREVAPARQLLDFLVKERARASVNAAVASRAIESLQQALVVGEDAGLAETELAEARSVLEVEERKAAARADIREALKGPLDVDTLTAALSTAEAAELTFVELKPVKDALAKERAKADCAVQLRATLQALAGGAEEADERAALVERLRSLVWKCRDARLPKEELEHAQGVLATEDEQAAVREALLEAMRSGSAEALAAALARGGAVAPWLAEVRARAEAAFAQARLRDALGALSVAEAQRDPEALARSIAAAEAAGASLEELAGPRRVRAEELLRRALPSRALHLLRDAVGFADAWHRDARDLPEARAEMELQVRREAARVRLRAAVKGSDEVELVDAIRCCQNEGLEEWETKFATKALRERSLAYLGHYA